MAFAEKALAEGWKYWYGCCGYKATQSLYDRKKKQYPKHYTDGRTATYKKHIAEGRMVADCVGLIKAFFWTSNGVTDNKYQANGCPDRSANGMFSLCEKTGKIATIPTTPGLVVWNDGHIGVSVDGVYAIEERGFNYGIVKTKIADRSWTNWGKLPASMLDYMSGDVAQDTVDEAECPYAEPAKNLKKGSEGTGVQWIQWMLESCGYSVGSYGIDGDFRSATHSAVTKFQRDQKLEVDGIVGKLTRAALKEAQPKLEINPDAEDDPDDAEAEPAPEVAVPEVTAPADEYEAKGKIADLSKWQGAIDWSKAARELDFCILRAQYGHEKIDEKYKEYALGCEEHDIPYGAYSYCLFDDEETAVEEAHFFAERIAGTNPNFLVLDIEPGGVKAQDIRGEVSAYISELRKLGVERIGLYIAHHAYKAYNINVDEADFVWIPRYGTNSGQPEKEPDYPCALWQYTSNGLLGGVKGRVDLNKLMDETRMAWFRGKE